MAARVALALLVALGTVTLAVGAWTAGRGVLAQLDGRPELARDLLRGLAGFAGVFLLVFSAFSFGLVPTLVGAGCVLAVLTLPGWLRRVGVGTRRPPLPRSLPPVTHRLADDPGIPIEEVIAAAEWYAEHPPRS
jgi:hypothetical protein